MQQPAQKNSGQWKKEENEFLPISKAIAKALIGIVVIGANSGTDGVAVYYTDNAAAMTNLNSYQIADIISANASDFEAADFLLK